MQHYSNMKTNKNLIGRGIREYTPYADEVKLSKECGYDFNQVWFYKGDMLIGDKDIVDKAAYIKSFNYPIIIHAMWTLDDFTTHGDKLLELVRYFGHKEVIVHPTGTFNGTPEAANLKLKQLLTDLNNKLKKMGARLYVENNSRPNVLNCTASQIKTVLESGAELLIDTGHIDSYEHLAEILKVRRPSCLHLANKFFVHGHEHLPLRSGEIDLKLLFTKYFKNYSGRIIVEVSNDFATNKDFLESKQALDEIFL